MDKHASARSSDLRRRNALSRVALICLGTALVLGLLAVFLAGIDFLVEELANDATAGWTRDAAGLIFALAAVCVVGALLGVGLMGSELVRRVPGAQRATIILEWIGSATLLGLVGMVALVGGGITLVVFVVGSTAAAGFVLYGAGELMAYLFSISLRWGLVISCGLLVVLSGAGGLVHDVRLEVMPPHVPPKEYE